MESGKKKMVKKDLPDSKRQKTITNFEGRIFVILDENPLKPTVPPVWPLGPRKEKEKEEPSTSKEISPLLSKAELKDRLIELGAIVHESPSKETFAIATFQPDTYRAKARKQLQTHLLIHGEFLCKCVVAKKWRAPAPLDCLFADDKTKQAWGGKYDKYGDSYEEDVDAETLKKILDNVGDQSPREEDRESFEADVNELMTKVLKDTSIGLFHNVNVYLDTMDVIGNRCTEHKSSSLEITALDIQRFYGSVSKELNKEVTHVICEKRERALAFEKEKTDKGFDFELVSPEWVDASMDAGRILDVNLFRLV